MLRSALPVTLVVALAGALPVAAQSVRPAKSGLTAYRTLQGATYFPFARTRVPEAFEEDAQRGPGIRVNGAGELDPAGEDDLVELEVERVLANATFVLERGGADLSVWTTRTKTPGTELAFTGNRSAALDFAGADVLTLWVERTSGGAGDLGLALRALEPDRVVDRLLFHAFQGLVVALGGEDQVPSLPLDPNHGTYVVATELYRSGYDVRMRDEDQVGADGSGAVYTEVVNAIQNRGVSELAIFGYSHGGGSTHDLAERLDLFRGSIGSFAIEFTSYIDGVENDSNTDLDRELRRPPASAFHANHYQRGTFADFFLDGGPVTLSEPPPTGLDAETTAWGAGTTHFLVDDFGEVRDFIQAGLAARLAR